MAKYPAAFINNIAEEGTKEDAIKFLQDLWEENVDLKKELADLRVAFKLLELVNHK